MDAFFSPSRRVIGMVLTIFFITCWLTVFSVQAEEPPVIPSEKQVSTEKELIEALGRVLPGDTVILQNSIVKSVDEDIFLLHSGTDSNPITLDGQGYAIQGESPLQVSPFTLAAEHVILKNLAFRNLEAPGAGGLYLVSSNNIILDTVTFDQNIQTAKGWNGGGAFIASSGNLLLNKINFTKNKIARGGTGGGLSLADSHDISLQATTFTENQAFVGGGASLENTPGVSARAVLFSKNSADASGGGLSLSRSDRFTIAADESENATRENAFSNTFQANTAGSNGGGISLTQSNNASFKSTLFRENRAAYNGGGVFLSEADEALFSNVLFSDNTADQDGGGAYLTSSTNFLFSDSAFTGNKSRSGKGGGVFLSQSTAPVFKNVLFSKNSAVANGGGAYLTQVESPQFIEGTAFKDNTSPRMGAGAYLFSSNSALFDTVTFSGNSASQNAASGPGGGLYVHSSENVLITDSHFMENTGSSGGGAFFYNAPRLTLTDTQFTNNQATDSFGGGLTLSFSGVTSEEVLLQGLTFNENTAARYGGGAYLSHADGTTVKNTNFSGNSALEQSGGGVYLANAKNVSFTGVTFTSNQADSGSGGGIALSGTENTMVEQAVFTGNTAGEGGGVSVRGASDTIFHDAKFLENEAATGGGIWSDTALTVSGNSLFQKNTASKGGAVYLASNTMLTLHPESGERILFATPSDTLDGDSGSTVKKQGDGIWEQHAAVSIPVTLAGGKLQTADNASFTSLTLHQGTTLAADLSEGPLRIRDTLDIKDGGEIHLTGIDPLGDKSLLTYGRLVGKADSTTILVEGYRSGSDILPQNKTLFLKPATLDLVWNGADKAIWNINQEANWVLAGDQSGQTQKFYHADTVSFIGTGGKTVTLQGDLAPTSVNVTGEYAFTGSGRIRGAQFRVDGGTLHLQPGETARTMLADLEAFTLAGGATLKLDMNQAVSSPTPYLSIRNNGRAVFETGSTLYGVIGPELDASGLGQEYTYAIVDGATGSTTQDFKADFKTSSVLVSITKGVFDPTTGSYAVTLQRQNIDDVTPPDDGGTTPPDDGGDTPPDDGGTTPPDDGGDTPPDDGGTTPPDDGDLTPPDDGGTTPPDDGGVTPPDDGGTTPPDDGGVTPPDDGGTTPPDDGETTPPDDGGNTPPDDGGTTPPDDGGTTPPDQGGDTPPDNGGGYFGGRLNKKVARILDHDYRIGENAWLDAVFYQAPDGSSLSRDEQLRNVVSGVQLPGLSGASAITQSIAGKMYNFVGRGASMAPAMGGVALHWTPGTRSDGQWLEPSLPLVSTAQASLASNARLADSSVSLWALPFYLKERGKNIPVSSSLDADYTLDMWGGAIGTEAKLDRGRYSIGAIMAIGRADVDGRGDPASTENQADFVSTMLFGKWRPFLEQPCASGLELGLYAGYHHVENEVTQSNALGLRADFDANAWQAGVQAQWDFTLGDADDFRSSWIVTPGFGVDVLHYRRENFTAKQGGKALSKYGSATSTTTRLPLRLTLSRQWELDSGDVLRPEVSAAYIPALGDRREEYSWSLPGGVNTANISGPKTDRHTGEAGAGLTWQRNALSISVNYTHQFSEHRTGELLTGQIRWAF